MSSRRLTYSVAMATYNGGGYLGAQLRSIAEQTRPPDEMIVADDGSTDETVAILQRVASELRCALSLVEGGQRLGPVGNFERALERVTTDVVFLADQDDVWHPEKAATLMDRFELAPSVGGIFTDGSIISDDPDLRSKSLWGTVGFTPAEQRRWADDPMSILLRQNVVTGASLALRSHLLPALLPFPRAGWHDLSIAVLVASLSTLEPCPVPLLSYRLHEANAAGLPTGTCRSRVVDRTTHIANLDAQQVHWGELRALMLAHGVPAQTLARVDAKVEHLARRRAMPEQRRHRLGPAIAEWARGGYRTYAPGRWSLVRDLFGP